MKMPDGWRLSMSAASCRRHQPVISWLKAIMWTGVSSAVENAIARMALRKRRGGVSLNGSKISKTAWRWCLEWEDGDLQLLTAEDVDVFFICCSSLSVLSSFCHLYLYSRMNTTTPVLCLAP